MIYIRSNDEDFVEYIHWQPFDPVNGLNKTRAELEVDGFFVNNVPPVPETPTGKVALLYGNKETGALWYIQVDAPLTPEEKNDLLIRSVNELQIQNASIILALVMNDLI